MTDTETKELQAKDPLAPLRYRFQTSPVLNHPNGFVVGLEYLADGYKIASLAAGIDSCTSPWSR